jgi:hypothetical protein
MQNKSSIKLSRDKMIVDIDKPDLEWKWLETLSKLPGVQLDKDENVVLEAATIFK